MKTTTQLRRLIAEPGVLMAPGAYNALSARIIESEGFPAVYLGGMSTCASMLCIPDQSLITMSELLDNVRRVAGAVSIPIIADIDDGGGNALSVRRTIKMFEAAGVAGVHLEDHTPGKHYHRGGQLFPKPVAVQKIKAAVDARKDDDFVIIARCDAMLLAGGSLSEAIDRMNAYAEAGADMAFMPGLQLKDMKATTSALPIPLFDIVRDTPVEELRRNGLKIACYYFQAMQVAFHAVRELMRELKSTGTIKNLAGRIPTQQEYLDLVGSSEGFALAEKYGIV